MNALRLVILSLVLTGCSLSSCTVQEQIPREVTAWATASVWMVDTDKATGSGYFVAPGFLVTNRHVALEDEGEGEAFKEITLTNSTRSLQFSGEVVAIADDVDLALIKCDCPDYYPHSPEIQSHAAPKIGDRVYGAGYGAGYFQIHEGYSQGQFDGVYFLTSVTMVGGDSGSPLLSYDGKIRIEGIRGATNVGPVKTYYQTVH